MVMVANRLPIRRTDHGWESSPGGLASALLPVAAAGDGAWVGWAGVPGLTLSRMSHPVGDRTVQLGSVPLSQNEIDLYYDGFANGTIWPLYHDAVRTPTFVREWWDAYEAVNRRFAEATAEIAAPGGTVWVHDYQLQLVPGMLRDLRPDLRIGFFLHIPFPPQELFMQIPWRAEIVRGLLGADVIGFQVPVAARNFTTLARRLVNAKGPMGALRYGDRTVRVAAFPISIDVAACERVAADDSTIRRSEEIRRELGNPSSILLGVDRLDYTKGIDVRLRAFQELLRDGELTVPDCSLVQIAVPSRQDVEDYVGLRENVERLVGEINGEFGQMGTPAVHYLHRSLDFDELVALYRAADVMLVTPLRDGMNLVAKEYVGSRLDDTGELVLSEFAGAARELRGAHLVNPHDIAAVKQAIVTAVRARSKSDNRMRAMRKVVKRHDVHAWARSFLAALDT
ncbi:MAG: trehalose-6-phosphate synthase [Acidimicrobiia bacterium]